MIWMYGIHALQSAYPRGLEDFEHAVRVEATRRQRMAGERFVVRRSKLVGASPDAPVQPTSEWMLDARANRSSTSGYRIAPSSAPSTNHPSVKMVLLNASRQERTWPMCARLCNVSLVRTRDGAHPTPTHAAGATRERGVLRDLSSTLIEPSHRTGARRDSSRYARRPLRHRPGSIPGRSLSAETREARTRVPQRSLSASTFVRLPLRGSSLPWLTRNTRASRFAISATATPPT